MVKNELKQASNIADIANRRAWEVQNGIQSAVEIVNTFRDEWHDKTVKAFRDADACKNERAQEILDDTADKINAIYYKAVNTADELTKLYEMITMLKHKANAVLEDLNDLDRAYCKYIGEALTVKQ